MYQKKDQMLLEHKSNFTVFVLAVVKINFQFWIIMVHTLIILTFSLKQMFLTENKIFSQCFKLYSTSVLAFLINNFHILDQMRSKSPAADLLYFEEVKRSKTTFEMYHLKYSVKYSKNDQ